MDAAGDPWAGPWREGQPEQRHRRTVKGGQEVAPRARSQSRPRDEASRARAVSGDSPQEKPARERGRPGQRASRGFKCLASACRLGEARSVNGTQRGPAQKERGLAVTPTCIIFGFCPTPSWRKGHWMRRLPSTTGSRAPLIAEGSGSKGWGAGSIYSMWQSMGSTWALGRAASGPGEPWTPRPAGHPQ